MWIPALGLACVGVFVGAALARIRQQPKQHDDDGQRTAPPQTQERNSPDETESA